MNKSLLTIIIAVLLPLISMASVQNIVSCQSIFAEAPSRLDGIAGWGTKLLPADKFKNNKFYQSIMQKLLNSDTSIITPYWPFKGHGLRGNFDDLILNWSYYFSETILEVKKNYSMVKNGIDHHLTLLELRSSGTEANNYFYELAGHAYKKRTGKKAQRPQLLFFANPETGLFPYGGTSGRIAEMSIRYPVKPQETLENYLVPSPQTKYIGKIPVKELKRLKIAEDDAIEFIRQQVSNEGLEIGGIILEPISVSKGIHVFRKEFLLRLRALADELQVPIMADEIFTGGGRTGKFWAFQHYDGFYPDLISFGKGLEIKGVGWIQRRPISSGPRNNPFIWDFPKFGFSQIKPNEVSYENSRLDNTSVCSAADAARALAIIEEISDNKLVESARTNGLLILKRMRAQAVKLGLRPESVQGIGLVFHFGGNIDQFFPSDAVTNYEGRVTPFLTNTPIDWPNFIQN